MHERMHAWVDESFERTIKWCNHKWPSTPTLRRCSHPCLSLCTASPHSANASTRCTLARSLSLGPVSPVSLKNCKIAKELSLLDYTETQERSCPLPLTIPEVDEDCGDEDTPVHPPDQLLRLAVESLLAGKSSAFSKLPATAAPPNTPRQSSPRRADGMASPTAEILASKASAQKRDIIPPPGIQSMRVSLGDISNSAASQELLSPLPILQSLSTPVSPLPRTHAYLKSPHKSSTVFLSPRMSTPLSKQRGKPRPLRSAVSTGEYSPMHKVHCDILCEMSGTSTGTNELRRSRNSFDLAAMCLPSVSLTASENSYLIAAQHDWHDDRAPSSHPPCFAGTSRRDVLV
jgi:hypothetical protein